MKEKLLKAVTGLHQVLTSSARLAMSSPSHPQKYPFNIKGLSNVPLENTLN